MRRRRGSFPILPFLGRPQEFYIVRSDRIDRNLQHIYKLWRHPGQVNRHVLSFQAPPRNIRSTETVYCKQLMCHKTSHRRHPGQVNRHVLSFQAPPTKPRSSLIFHSKQKTRSCCLGFQKDDFTGLNLGQSASHLIEGIVCAGFVVASDMPFNDFVLVQGAVFLPVVNGE